MLEAVIADSGKSSVAELARAIGVPVSTAHRQVATLVAEGYLAPGYGGGHSAGPRLLGLLHRLDAKQIIVNAAAPMVHSLARTLRTVVQLGTLENDMVTYRIKTGPGATSLFTEVGMQLEAYCSGIGKVLLAHLPDAERDAYLAGGPFPALTARTITKPSDLQDELRKVRAQGYAFDNGEIVEGMSCVAVPIGHSEQPIVAALSATFTRGDHAKRARNALSRLQALARQIEANLTHGRIETFSAARGSRRAQIA